MTTTPQRSTRSARRGPRRLLAALTLGAVSAATLATAVPATANPGGDPTLAATDKGVVRGAAHDGLLSWQGVPYASPPERWTSPSPARPWAGVRDALAPGPSCAQPAGLPIGVPGDATDCLYLNVTAPANRTGELPVIVWIHGGSMMFGSGDFYGPDRLAENAVVVSVNYRLGVMSFLTDPSLDAGSANGSGSLAIEDQQAALRWVRANIASFGGDARNVTIMGESGGGYSVCDQLASPAARGLFDRAIVQSAPCESGATRTRAEAETDSRRVIEGVHCDTAPDVAACLRAVPVQTLLDVYGPWNEPRPVAGTPLLPYSPGEAFRSGRFNRVPVLIGVNHDEMRGQIASGEMGPEGHVMQPGEYEAALGRYFPGNAPAVMAEYPLSDFGGSAGAALGTALTDRDWSVPTYDTAKLLARWTPTHMFEFAEQDTPWYRGAPPVSFTVGAQHMAELAYFFELPLFADLTPEQTALAERMIAAWTAFATDGNPGWARFSAWNPYVQSIESGRWSRTDFTREHRYGFWSSL